MTLYIATILATGKEHEYQSDTGPIGWDGMNSAAEHRVVPDNAVSAQAMNLPQSVYGGRRWLSKFEFTNLFQPAEFTAIMDAVSVHVIAEIRDWWVKFQLLTPDADGASINLDDPSTAEGVGALLGYLQMTGVIANASARTAEVLRG